MTRQETPAPPPARYWAFISHSSRDAAQAAWLQRAIERYGIPAKLARSRPTPAGEPAPKRFRPIFRRAAPPTAAGLDPATADALRASRYLIVICSPDAAASAGINREVEAFAGWGRRERILACVVDGTPNTGDERECFPPALRGQEPLAADVRRTADGRNGAKLKLLAGMLGVGYDALRRREAQRRLRRLQRAMAAALALVLAFAGLALYANSQRVKAVRARQEAESVLEFLTTDLVGAIEPLGRPDLVQEVQRRVDEYYGRMQVDADRYQALHDQAAAATAAGEEAQRRGDADLALVQYQAGLDLAGQMVALDPANAVGQTDLATAHVGLGGVLGAQGKVQEALAEYRAGLSLLEPLAQARPQDLDLQNDLLICHANCGLLLYSIGSPAEALAETRTSLGLAQRLAEASPDAPSFRESLAMSHLLLGNMLYAQGGLAQALAEYQSGLAILQQLVAADAANLEWQSGLVLAHRRVGDALLALGNPVGALAEYRAGLAISERLAPANPDLYEWQQALYGSYAKVAQVLELSDPTAALEAWQQAFDTLTAMKQAEMDLGPDEEQLYEQLRQKLGR